MEPNINITEVEVIDCVAKNVFNGLVNEFGFVDLLIGCLIGLGTGAISTALYLKRCTNNKEEI